MTLQSTLYLLFLSNDMFTYFVAIELISIISSLLIMYKKDSMSVKAGLYFLVYNTLGMLIYLMGVMFIYNTCGSVNLDIVQNVLKEQSNGNNIVNLAKVLIIAGIGVKSAWGPVSHWLPIAHASAPGAVSAMLSGLIVKTGIFLLIRFQDILSLSSNDFFLAIGLFSGIYGVMFAIIQTDIKKILAYHTISQVGLILVGISYMGIYYYSGIFHIWNHFVFKSLLFLVAGLIINHTGERNIKRISGVIKTSPLLGLLLIFGILGITGFPFFIGSLSKYLIIDGSEYSYLDYLLIVINLGTILSFIKILPILYGNRMTKTEKITNRAGGAVLMVVLLLVSYPIELRLLDKSLVLGYKSHVLSGIGEYFIMLTIGLLVYELIFKKYIYRGNNLFDRLKPFGILQIPDATIAFVFFVVITFFLY
jgi:multicomponent Na+:H+ antiporter subunit D